MAMAGRLLAFLQDNILWLIILGILFVIAFIVSQQALEAERLKGQLREFGVTLINDQPAEFLVNVSEPGDEFANNQVVPVLYRLSIRETVYSDGNIFRLDSNGRGSVKASFEADLNPGELIVLGVWLRTACMTPERIQLGFPVLLQDCAQTFIGARNFVVD